MSKYIVKSCSNLTTSYYADGDIIHNQCGLTDDDALCKDCTDCVMKQIVELCKEELNSLETYIDTRSLECVMLQNILKLLDIQEVE